MIDTLTTRRTVTLFSLVLLGLGCPSGGPGDVPEEAIRHNILGTAYLGQQNWAEAEAAFQKALELRPSDPLLLTNRAIALNQKGEIEPAVDLLRRALELDPDYPSAHYNLGLIESRRGNFEEAALHFEAVARFDAEELFNQYYLGAALSRIDREEEAIRSFRAALASNPDHVSSLYSLGRLLLQRGDQEEGTRLITRSQEVRARSGLDEAVGSQYGEQGPYSMGIDYAGGDLAAPPAIPVGFSVAAQMRVEPGSNGIPSTLARLEEKGAPVLMAAQGAAVLQLVPSGRSEPLAEIDGGEIVSLAAVDTDNDGRVELSLLVARQGATRLEPVLMPSLDGGGFGSAVDGAFTGDAATALAAGVGGADLTVVDRDHDGDLDLFWCWTSAQDPAAGCKLATNDGSGRFEVRPAEQHGFSVAASGAGPVTAAFSDVDNDRDVDLLVAGPAGVRLYSNQRDGNFAESPDHVGRLPYGAVTALAIADMNKDGWMDLLLDGAQGMQLALNRRGRFEAPVAFAGGGGDAAADLLVFDLDNDGFLDIARGAQIHHNRGADQWESRSDLLAIDGLSSGSAPFAALDADADGDLDLVTADAEGAVTLLQNDGGNAHRFILLDSRGVGDNKFGIGAKVEVLAGALRQKYEVTRPVPLHVGLASRTTVESARYLWPSGVLQDEVELKAGEVQEIAQLDRKGTSCPLLYAWRDGRWRFVTDFLGGCAIGYQQAPGVFSIPDTDEYVRIEGGLTENDDGRLVLRLNNQLEEVIWFDQVELVVVDHPEGTEVYPNERLMPGPPFPEFRLFASDEIRPIVAARGVEDGRDLTELLRLDDRRYVDNFELLRPKGYASLHTLEIDLGPFDRRERAVLLLDGWIDYADSSANVAAAQAGLKLVPPRLELADGEGGWVEVEGLMGFPAGLPKTMAVELTGLFPSSDHRLRIATNMRIYWDRARLMLRGEGIELKVTRLSPSSAELRFGGYPRETSPDGRRPFGYDPYDVAPTRPWKAHVGSYTPFGEVVHLVERIDDRFVTTKHGDEMELSFTSPGPVASGFERTYLLYADGFGKDMDPNSAANNEVGPIPFHGMPRYPYPAEVAPPVPEQVEEQPPRRVLPSPEGWPGTPARAGN